MDVFTGQALKGGRGEDQWRRFFALMGTHIAIQEQGAIVPNTFSEKLVLQDEIVNLVTDLDVFTHLESYRRVMQGINIPGAHYYLVEIDAEKQQTMVWGYKENEVEDAQQSYLSLERSISGKRDKDAVLVAAGSLDSLKRAYPNYFADTHVFLRSVREAIGQEV